MHPRTLVQVVLIGSVLAGCVGQGPSQDLKHDPDLRGRLPGDLQMVGFKELHLGSESATWRWTDAVPAYLGVGTPPAPRTASFELPEDMSFRLGVSLDYGRPAVAFLAMSVTDESDRIVCSGPCILDFPEGRTPRGSWEVNIWQDAWPSDEIPFDVSLELTLTDPRVATPVAFAGSGVRPLPPELRAEKVVVRPTGLRTSEPSIGVTSEGVLFTPTPPVRAGPSDKTDDQLTVLRSADGGRSWQPLPIPSTTALDLDPWMWVDPGTDRIFRLALLGACSEMAVSDDKGETWRTSHLDGCGLPGGHYQKLTTGPPPPGVTTQGYPNVVYYGSSLLSDYPTGGVLVGHTGGVWVSPSLDGGESWQVGALAHPARRGCQGWGGPVVVAPDGTAFSAAQYCDGVRIAVSRDAGKSWHEDAMLTDRGHMGGILGPSMAVDPDGRMYLVYPSADGGAILRTRDPGSGAWSEAVPVMPPGVKAATFTVVDAAAPGRVALAFLGTTSDPRDWAQVDPLAAPDDADWHLHLVLSWDALAHDPTFVSFQATPEDDPVQRGCIDLAGSQTPSCRNLADFMDMTLLQGRPIVAFTDGCIHCASADDSTSSVLALALLEAGIGLDGKPPEAS